MARKRIISPDFWVDEKMAGLPRDTRLFYIGTWNFADDYGNLPHSAMRLKGLIFPFEEAETSTMLKQLIEIGCLKPYTVDGQQCLHITSWERWQRVEYPSKPTLPLFAGQTLYAGRHRQVADKPPTGRPKEKETEQKESGGDARLKELSERYEFHFGRLMPSLSTADSYLELIEEYGAERVYDAMKKAVDTGHRDGSVNYIKAILAKKPRQQQQGPTYDYGNGDIH